MQRFYRLTLVLLILAIGVPLFAQVQISGTVTDRKTGDPLVGVNVLVEGTRIGGATDLEGRFTFAYRGRDAFRLVVSYVGYKTIKLEMTEGSMLSGLTFEMNEDPFLSDEIVVTGIASRTAKAVSPVAVDRIRASDYTETNDYKDLSELLQGKIAGVTVQSASGTLGQGFRFKVRSGGGLNGNGQPVIYIDGIRVDNSMDSGIWVGRSGSQGISMLSHLNPEDIEKIEVLKGPAGAASYGTGGSNGVILITTKRGGMKAGVETPFTVNYRGTLGWNTQDHVYTEADHLNYRATNSVFRNGQIEYNNVNVTGGMGIFRYYASFDRSFEKSHTYGNFTDKTNVRANFDVFPSETFTLRVSTGFAYNEIRSPLNDNALYGYLANTWLPSVPWTYADSAAIWNDLHYQKQNRFTGSIQAEFTPYEGFEARLIFGVDDGDARTDATRSPEYAYGGVTTGQRDIDMRNNQQFTYQGDVRYTYNLYGVNITSAVGAQLFDRRVKSFWTTTQDFLTSLITDIGAGETFLDTGESLFHAKEAGIFTEHSLSYGDTYFGTLMIRRDYATVIGYEAPSITYPAASFAIRLDRFDITPSFFNLLKFRVAYGETGKLPGRLDGMPLLWSPSQSGYGVGASLSRIGNPLIEPETVKELELGFDTEFFDNYGIEFTYYQQWARNSIISFANVPSSGKTASSVPYNIGELKGWGFESRIQASPVRSRNFQITFNLIVNYQNNKVTDLGTDPSGNPTLPIYSGMQTLKEGLPRGQYYYQGYDGVEYFEDGTYRRAKLTEDRVDLGPGHPLWTGSFTTDIRLFRNLNLYVLTDWMAKFKIRNRTRWFQIALSRGAGNVHARFRELEHLLSLRDWSSWLSETGRSLASPPAVGTPEYIKYAEEFSRWDTGAQANFLEWGDFFKLREVSVSYNLRDLLPKLGGLDRYVQNITLGVSGKNLWTKTKYSWYDPEVSWYGGDTNFLGNQDFDTVPRPKIYQMWFRISF